MEKEEIKNEKLNEKNEKQELQKEMQKETKQDKLDYEKLGLKCGIEIHQQIDTDKLFCSCPSLIRDDNHDIEVIRKLNMAFGETGELDKAAQYESKKDKSFKYLGYKDTTCLVEFDEEPPHDMNRHALKVALTAAKMMNATFVDEVHVMRKIVIDGSNTSGFQRTALVAFNGTVRTNSGNINIPTICIEEESAKIVERTPGFDIYNLSRLGIPLVEIASAPEIKTPEQAKEVCAHIGMILRSTGKVKRGLGTIRQDVNVSIADGSRVEIKGAQDLKSIPKLIENEVMRQNTILEVKAILKKNQKSFVTPEITNLTELFKGTQSKVVKSALAKKEGSVYGIKLKGFSGLVGKEVQPGRRIGTEFSDYAKVAGVGGIFHSDELPNYGITDSEVISVRNTLACTEGDAFALVCDEDKKARLALEFVIERAKLCFAGVPKEVRKANQDNTTSFMRPMPGSARMYPETDIKPIENFDPSEIDIPKTLEEQANDFVQKYGIALDMARFILDSDYDVTFVDFCKKYINIKPAYIAQTITGIDKDIKKQFGKDISPTISDFEIVFNSLDRGIIAKESVILIFSRHGEKPMPELVKEYKIMSDDELRKILQEIADKNKGMKLNVLMGIAMKDLRGKVSGQKISEELAKLVKE